MNHETINIFRFKFTSPLHLANERADDYGKSETIFHSDVLYAAIISAWAKLGINQEFFEEESPDLGFAISSLFPYSSGNCQKDKKTSKDSDKEDDKVFRYFFPKPLCDISNVEPSKLKKAKKARFIEKNTFFKFLRDGVFSFEDEADGFILDYNADKFCKPFQSEVLPRVLVPRNEGDSQPYYIDRIFFRENCGLFCLAKFDNEQIKNYVISALKFLEDEGIGTDRNVGNGKFKLEDDTFETSDFKRETTEYALNLSLYCPTDQQELRQATEKEAVRYDLLKRGGWITADKYLHLRKKSVYMFSEGSILSFPSESQSGIFLKGKTVDLKPEAANVAHPIWRTGRSLFFPVHIAKQD